MTEKNKIVYIIFSNNIDSGVGGHYYSLREISNSMRDDNDISIINIGFLFSKVFKDQPFKTYFIKHHNLIRTCALLKRLIEKLKPDILHTFDLASLTLLKIIMTKKKIKHIHTVCGGPNPKYFIFTQNLVVFSQENYEYFKRNTKFNDVNIFLIPNRVLPIKSDFKRISMLLREVKMEFPIILRICRINDKYIGSLIQSINLVKNIRKKGIEANLLIIGVPDKRKVLEFIIKYENTYIKILTQEKYTLNANQLIEAADFVIGTGRSFMEGAYFSKVMLVPQRNQNIPLLIDKETFEAAFKVNFSERTIYEDYDDPINFNKVIQCIENKGSYEKLSSFIKNKSKKYFEISTKRDFYNEIYTNLEPYYLNQNMISLLKESSKIIKILYNHNILSIFKNFFFKILKNISRYH